MGNRALTSVLKDILIKSSGALPAPKFNQVVLTAPDMDTGRFKQLAADIPSAARRVTLYASTNDRALLISKQIHGYPRAGEAGESITVVPGIDTVDVSALETDIVGHVYHRNNASIISDLFQLIRHKHPPDERFGLLRESVPGGFYWKFRPGNLADPIWRGSKI